MNQLLIFIKLFGTIAILVIGYALFGWLALVPAGLAILWGIAGTMATQKKQEEAPHGF